MVIKTPGYSRIPGFLIFMFLDHGFCKIILTWHQGPRRLNVISAGILPGSVPGLTSAYAGSAGACKIMYEIQPFLLIFYLHLTAIEQQTKKMNHLSKTLFSAVPRALAARAVTSSHIVTSSRTTLPRTNQVSRSVLCSKTLFVHIFVFSILVVGLLTSLKIELWEVFKIGFTEFDKTWFISLTALCVYKVSILVCKNKSQVTSGLLYVASWTFLSIMILTGSWGLAIP